MALRKATAVQRMDWVSIPNLISLKERYEEDGAQTDASDQNDVVEALLGMAGG